MGAEGGEGDDVAKQKLAGEVAQEILGSDDRQAIVQFVDAERRADEEGLETPEAAWLSPDPGMFRRALEAFARLRAITKRVLHSGRDM